jgi:aerotaxis receptor
MRKNLPISQREYEFPADATLMSTTDTKSRVTYANAAFLDASGFAPDEIVGQPHNLVRHPDMPPEAFADMWATLQGGESWTGLVKNRRKNGDHYWVRANATPVMRDGKPVAYMSVRTKPAREEVARAEQLYARMREGKAEGLRLHKGVVLRRGAWAWLSLQKTLPVRWRVRLPLLAIALAGAAALALTAPLTAALFAALALTALFVIEAQVVKPLEALAAHARRVAGGDTRESLQMDRVDEIGMALRSLNQLGLMFRWVIDDVASQVVTVQGSSGDIVSGNTELSARTEQAAASLQQTAASMEQMSATVRSNADAAREAENLAASASVAAQQGGEVVREVNSTMGDITAASKRIGDIVGVIDGIAFQTNILALNAAVEAARAGDQGRGFAVVAGEVRALAQRSAVAAKEIKSLISDSVERVEQGGRQVDEAQRAMGEIVGQVRRVSALIGSIGSATRDQATGIAQVSQAVTQLDRTTQENSALVLRSASASDSLEKQATQLVQAVAVFRLH